MKGRFHMALLILMLIGSSMPSLTSEAQHNAPILDTIVVNCNYAMFTGRTVSRTATSITMTVNTEPDLDQPEATAEPDATESEETELPITETFQTIGETYSANVVYPPQPAETRLTFAITEYDTDDNQLGGEWVISFDCNEPLPVEPPPLPTLTVTDLSETTCSTVTITGEIGTPAPQVAINISTTDNLTNTLAREVATVSFDSFEAVLEIPQQPTGTNLVIAVGEWDGQNFLAPAAMQSITCTN